MQLLQKQLVVEKLVKSLYRYGSITHGWDHRSKNSTKFEVLHRSKQIRGKEKKKFCNWDAHSYFSDANTYLNTYEAKNI